jgi:putative phosphoribosyl transferase
MFANRRSAGRQLAAWLQQLREEKPVVLALPRGGVPVGFEIAEGLNAPLDIVLRGVPDPDCEAERPEQRSTNLG